METVWFLKGTKMTQSLVNGFQDSDKISTLDDKTKQERRDKLNSIGFVWSVREAGRSSKWDKMWNDKFERLVQYKQEHGDCLVSNQS